MKAIRYEATSAARNLQMMKVNRNFEIVISVD
jgi:hypothetical protein